MRNIIAVAGVVIKELYRRKDFYVLFIVTVLICYRLVPRRGEVPAAVTQEQVHAQ